LHSIGEQFSRDERFWRIFKPFLRQKRGQFKNVWLSKHFPCENHRPTARLLETLHTFKPFYESEHCSYIFEAINIGLNADAGKDENDCGQTFVFKALPTLRKRSRCKMWLFCQRSVSQNVLGRCQEKRLVSQYIVCQCQWKHSIMPNAVAKRRPKRVVSPPPASARQAQRTRRLSALSLFPPIPPPTERWSQYYSKISHNSQQNVTLFFITIWVPQIRAS
jgi:hypothetical protein